MSVAAAIEKRTHKLTGMELAGQWRREWAGTAEYGKVIEGGVTRQVARAMEVLNASTPGAKVRVMRAAYHSSAGPGAPASSYLMHSSRQVISSGYNFLEPSSLPSKPLEISSTPLESSPDSEVERENYKVTEPDDYDISEPSKWRGSTRTHSIRMPSEESSSTDNASIIDLDSRTSSRSTLRRSQSKHSDDMNRIHTINTRISPLLDAPVALSTLKYTSLLNGSDDWNSRRKSYSFEDTSPINKSFSPENNSFTMDSSTDSGICKSSEIVNDQPNITKYGNNYEKMNYNQDETFKEWLSRNRSTSYKSMTPPANSYVAESQKNEDKITVKASGKVTITLPMENLKEKQTEIFKSDENDRRAKKVEFCKTELHFAVDTGTVNIIATDEKPPPSNDFRRRRSAFVPLNEKIDKSITLFGDKTELTETNTHEDGMLNIEFSEVEENTAATKSILKNKIPKPKPYLLGENMEFGNFNDNTTNLDINNHVIAPSAVSLINRQLLSKRRHSNETISSCASDSSTILDNYRARTKGPQQQGSSNHKESNNGFTETFKHKSHNLKISAISQAQSNTKMRELRGTDLTYFGIDDNEAPRVSHSQENLQEEIFHSVKLVQQISNSVCNSEADSDEAPEYQNLIHKYNFSATPTPKPRTKYIEEVRKINEPRILKPIIEQDVEKIVHSELHRSTVKKRNESPQLKSATSSKFTRETTSRHGDVKNSITNEISLPGRSKANSLKKIKSNKENETLKSARRTIKPVKNTEEPPLYVNLQAKAEKALPILEKASHKSRETRAINRNESKVSKSGMNTIRSITSDKDKDHISEKAKQNRSIVGKEKKNEIIQETSHHTKKQNPRRTEKLTTPDNAQEKYVRLRPNDKNKSSANNGDRKYETDDSNSSKKKSHKDVSKPVVSYRSTIKKKEETKDDLSETGIKVLKNKKINNIYAKSNETSIENKIPLKPTRGAMNSNYTIKSSTIRTGKTSNLNMRPEKTKSKHSKYVINYDDKNGTVSSICKIKSGPGTYTRKLITIENKEPQEYTNDKSLNKITLQ